jgi:hypothetical protein
MVTVATRAPTTEGVKRTWKVVLVFEKTGVAGSTTSVFRMTLMGLGHFPGLAQSPDCILGAGENKNPHPVPTVIQFYKPVYTMVQRTFHTIAPLNFNLPLAFAKVYTAGLGGFRD